MDAIGDLLEQFGPMLTGELASRLGATLSLSPPAARQRVSRALPHLKNIRGLAFARNARFVYLAKQYGSPGFWKALIAALNQSGGGYSRALQAIEQRGGLMPIAHFAIASGSAGARSKQLSAEEIRRRLVDAGLLEELTIPDVGPCVGFARNSSYLDELVPAMRARLIAEDVLLQAIRNWARNLNLGSYRLFSLRSSNVTGQPQVGGLEWDGTAPSDLAPFLSTEHRKVKQGFFVFDVLLDNHAMTPEGVAPFIYKCSTLRVMRNLGPCIPMLVTDGYSRETFKLVRGHGIMPATPASLFGEDIAEALRELTRTLTGAAKAAVDTKKFTALFDRLNKIEGAAGTLRGSLFEFIAADLANKCLHARVTMNEIYRENGKDVAEVDVLAEIPHQKTYFIECKGYAPGNLVSDDEVKKWLTVRIPIVRKKALENAKWRNLPLHFELWTTGQLSEDAKAIIGRTKEATSKYFIDVRQADAVHALAKQTKDPTLIKALEQHFLRHPLNPE
jgi:hypothetical protein